MDKQKLEAILSDPDFMALPEAEQDSFLEEMSTPTKPSGFQFDYGKAMEPLKNPSNVISGMAPQMVAGEFYSQARDAGVRAIPEGVKKNLGRGVSATFLGPASNALKFIPGAERAVGDASSGLGIDLVSGGVSDAMGAIAPAVAGSLRRASAPLYESAGKTMNELIKPLNRNMQFGKTPGLEMAKRGMVSFTQKGLSKKVSQHLAQLSGQLAEATRTGKPVDIRPVIQALGVEYRNIKAPLGDVGVETGTDAAESVERLAKDIMKLAGPDPSSVPADRALNIKRWVGKQTSNFSRQADKGTQASAAQSGYVALDKAQDVANPSTKAMNESMSNLMGAKDALKHGTAREARKSPFGLFDRIAALGAGIAGFGGGGGVTAAKAALGGLALSKLAGSTIAKSSTASALARGGRGLENAASGVEQLAGPGVYRQLINAVKTKPTQLVPVRRQIRAII